MSTRRGYGGWAWWVTLAGLGLSVGCSGGNGEADASDVVSELRSDAARVTPDASEAKLAGESEQAFGFGFLQALAADQNTAFSPHSLSNAFAMLTDAAAGQTLAEVEQTLKFGATGEAFHRSQDALALALAARNRDAVDSERSQVEAQVLTQSNDIWMRDDVPPDPSYLDTLARFYGVGVHHADFPGHPEQVRKAINAKVSQDTHQLIRELIPPSTLNGRTVSVLTNALYFKAPWAKRLSAPTPGDFHQLDGSTRSVPMLATQTELRYATGDGFVSVALPYYGGDLELMLIVPDDGAYARVRAELSSELLSQTVAAGQIEQVTLTLPKFEVKSAVPAGETLEAMGMNLPFDPENAEFPKLSPPGRVVCISDVLHEATVAIDEKGTEASAATAAVLSVTVGAGIEPLDPKIVNVDRPFLFTIRDNPTGAMLFIGQIVAP